MNQTIKTTKVDYIITTDSASKTALNNAVGEALDRGATDFAVTAWPPVPLFTSDADPYKQEGWRLTYSGAVESEVVE